MVVTMDDTVLNFNHIFDVIFLPPFPAFGQIKKMSIDKKLRGRELLFFFFLLYA
jgi:hypothetical protein